MSKPTVVILGCTGMLGSMTLDSFARGDDFNIIATFRNPKAAKVLKKKYPKVNFRKLDAEKTNLKGVMNAVIGARWVVNAIGVIKPFIRDDNAQEIHRAIHVNARFPHLLVQAIENTNSKVIQIATDCVYSGAKGRYVEADTHDALDVYGKTKSLGEVFKNQIYHLRCSIIGSELRGHKSLLDWFLSQPKGANVNGFTNHQWNGITTLHFAKVCQGIINKKLVLPRLQHVVPGNKISKAKLLKSFAKEFDRQDIIIQDIKAPSIIDRTLSTQNEKLNKEIWRAAGYNTPPSIQEMIKELANYSLAGKAGKI